MMNKLAYKIPTLNPGPVKKEIMQCLRDIAVDEQAIRYHEYSDGIITGCQLVEEDMQIGLINGMVKFSGRIYKLREKSLLPYEPTDDWTALKLRFGPQIHDLEYIHYSADLTLDTSLELKENEMEMGRFKLKKGSRLRTSYKNFWDMGTEYDTVNLLYLQQSSIAVPTLSPAITMYFAREAFPYATNHALDSAFCTACLQTGAPVSRELIQQYVCLRNEDAYREMSNVELHQGLVKILDLISGRSQSITGQGRGARGSLMLID